MSNLHSRSLFHFTTLGGLLGIVSSGFQPRFCKERLVFEGAPWDYWIPMVSFCDIPLSLVTCHINEYGSYGLGMKREWALESGLNPVFYYQTNSKYFGVFNEMMSEMHQDVEELKTQKILINSIDRRRKNSRYLFQYYKTYKGYNFKTSESKWFYDEREWRYVPNASSRQCLIRDDSSTFSDDIRHQENTELEQYALKFTAEDISYVLIGKESERFEFIREFSRLKFGSSQESIEVLNSKILSVEQIREDF